MRPPAFWHHDGLTPLLLSPLAALVAASTARRVARPGWRAPVPVICCGNATVGGAGKTTLALDLLRRLIGRGVAVHAITRGYGGRSQGVLRVAGQGSAMLGDEPLLLAEVATTWVGADREASARAAVAAGAQALVMDDGLQNPGLVQDCALLVIDGAAGFGNGHVLPAGPLREPVAAAAQRCRAAVLIGDDERHAIRKLPLSLAVLRAHLEPTELLVDRRLLAFAGIARPGKFRQTLEQAGAEVAELIEFPDHHRFTRAEILRVKARAASLGAEPVTTPKDATRLPPGFHPLVADVRLVWDDPAALDAVLPC